MNKEEQRIKKLFKQLKQDKKNHSFLKNRKEDVDAFLEDIIRIFWKEVTKQKKVETLNLFEWYQKSKWKPFLKKYYNYDEIQSLELHHDHEYNDNWYEYRVTSFTLLDNEGRKIPEIDFDSSYEIDDMSPDEYESKYWDDYWECQKDTPLYNEHSGSDYKPNKTNLKIIFK